jgi:CxxC-x17-CxxC domain-containing protein
MPNPDINFFAETTYRNIRKKFGIKTDDRRRHVYVIGKTGMGKTNMIQNMAIQDIQNGHGLAFVDPHGEAAEALLDFIPSSRANDVVYFNPADLDWPIAFNVMEEVSLEYRHLVAGGLMGVFKKIWPDVWSARMEYILNNTILALLEYPGSTLLAINRMLSDVEFRALVVEKITDPVVRAFWVTEFSRYSQKYETEATAAIQNKVGQFISTSVVRNIIGQVKSTIDMRDIMDTRKILIMNLAKGRMGEDNSTLLGALMITKLQLAAMSRIDILEADRKDFYLYVDEFQNFATESFANILSEARKFRLSLILGHQYITQMEEEVRDAVFGNVGTIISFRVGAEDAEFLEKEFSPDFTAEDFVNLGKYDIYLKLMIDGLAGRPFSARTLAPFPAPVISNRDNIIKASREKYATPRNVVEDRISEWAGFDKALAAEIKVSAKAGNNKGGETTLYDARCSVCGKDTKTIFEPDGKRPIYCKSCLKKAKAANKPAGQAAQNNASSGQKDRPKIENNKVVAEQKFVEQKREENIKPDLPSVSFEEALNHGAVSFGGKQIKQNENNSSEKRHRKEVDISELKKTLKESLKSLKQNSDDEEDSDSYKHENRSRF